MHLYSLNHDKTNIANQKNDIFIKPKGITLVLACRLGECCTTQGAKSSELIVLPPAVSLFFCKMSNKIIYLQEECHFCQLLSATFEANLQHHWLQIRNN